MKTSTTFALLFALIFAGNFSFAQSLQPETNWLQAWKNFAGTQYSATWLSEEVANGATVFTHPTTGNLIVMTTVDGNSMAELQASLEEGIQAGNGNQMLAGDAAQAIDNTSAQISWKGQLGGRPL